jgi:hypothetical protein
MSEGKNGHYAPEAPEDALEGFVAERFEDPAPAPNFGFFPFRFIDSELGGYDRYLGLHGQSGQPSPPSHFISSRWRRSSAATAI